MGYHDLDEVAGPPARDGLESAQRILGAAVRALGAALMIVGLAVAVGVVLEAWALYKTPERIERFAAAIEAGSHLDAAVSGLTRGAGTPETPARPSTPPLRLSYFAAWLVAIALLLVVGMLAMSAVGTGGRLALGNPTVRRPPGREPS